MYVHACSPAHSIYAYSNGFPSFHVYNMLILLIIFLILHIANPNGWCRSYIQNIRIMCTTYSWYSWLLHSLPPARPKRHQNNHNLNIIIDCLGISLLIKSYESEIEMILKSEMRFVVWLSFPSGYTYCLLFFIEWWFLLTTAWRTSSNKRKHSSFPPFPVEMFELQKD